MRSVVMLGDRRVDVIDVPDPQPQDHFVVVEVKASGLCGTERWDYEGPRARDESRGYNGGHEHAGVVCKVDKSRRVREGDRVAPYGVGSCGRCRYCLSGNWILCDNYNSEPTFPGGHSQFVRVADHMCLPIADDTSFDTASLFCDLFGTTYHAIKRARITGFETVLITGQGPVGLSAMMLCKFINAFVIAVEVNPARAKHARSLGADVVLNPDSEPDLLARIQEAAGPRGVDVAIDCSANPVAQTLCLDALRKQGRMAFVGLTKGGPTINTQKHFILKELELIGSWYSRPEEFAELEAMTRRGLDVDALITHRFGIEQAQTAFDTFFGGSASKVILDPSST